jgi:DNA-binding NarL/FixJ family response regulator
MTARISAVGAVGERTKVIDSPRRRSNPVVPRASRPEGGPTESLAEMSGGGDSVSVLVVDDSPAFRHGMARAVRAHAGLELVGEVGGGESALEAIDRLEPDVVLLDLVMPDLDGIGVLERLRAADPPRACRVVLVSATLDEDVERAALAAGAAACLSKDRSRADICATALRLARE